MFGATLVGKGIDDISWYALYNAVLAIGCRTFLAAESTYDFRSAEEEALGYFKNALAVHMELVHSRTSLMSVQVMRILTATSPLGVFGQGVATPQLDYMLSSLAARVAQAKGLHKRCYPDCGLTTEQIDERSNVFWSTYVLDKIVSLRSGRPSAINDDDVSCVFPPGRPPSSSGPLQNEDNTHPIFIQITRLARIISKICCRFYSASSLTKDIVSLIPTRDAIERDLCLWRDSLPDFCHPNKPIRLARMGPHSHPNQALFLRFTYYDAVCALHRRFTAPYLFCDEDRSLVADQEQPAWRRHSVSRSLESARQMVLSTKYIEVLASTPSWLLVYFPLTALLTLFTHTIANPTSAAAPKDTALMGVINGLFGHLEFLAPGLMNLRHAVEFERVARGVVTAANTSSTTSEHHTSCVATAATAVAAADSSPSSFSLDNLYHDNPMSDHFPHLFVHLEQHQDHHDHDPHTATTAATATTGINATSPGFAEWDMAGITFDMPSCGDGDGDGGGGNGIEGGMVVSSG
ncbi:MAG: hypothetical protein M1819_000928 [Sarea resinae]|nr:MAG: hypothetical protein M1819_000928 [Sarea resinae]